MSDETPNEGMDRRRFLTVLGATGAGAMAGLRLFDRADREAGSLPGPVRRPGTGHSDLLRQHLHRVHGGMRAACEDPRGSGDQARGQSPAPGQRGQDVLPRANPPCRASTIPGRLTGPKARQPDGSFKDVTWDDAIAALTGKLGGAAGKVAVISGAGRGTFSDFLAEWTAAAGGRVVRYEPLAHEALRAANLRIFGTDELPAHDFAAAKYIVSFGADFLENWLSPLENQRGFSRSHGYRRTGKWRSMSAFAPRMSLTGMNADEWHATKPGADTAIVLAMANVLLNERSGNPADANALRGSPCRIHSREGPGDQRRRRGSDPPGGPRVRLGQAESRGGRAESATSIAPPLTCAPR